MSDAEQSLLDLINQARQNPLTMAESLGMDPDQVLRDLPGLADILTNGLPPVDSNQTLYEVASAHNQDMLDNIYYAHDSLDGSTYEDRIKQSGCFISSMGESLGMLAFRNFIDPAVAAQALFTNMFLDELNPMRAEKRNILDPLLREAGVSISAGSFSLEDETWNVYVTTVDFGNQVDTVYAFETALLRLINEGRENPRKVVELAGIEVASAVKALGEYSWVLDTSLPPLARNEVLGKAAQGHTQDMIGQNYYGTLSPEGAGPGDRAAFIGYKGHYVGESLWAGNLAAAGLELKGEADVMAAAKLIYNKMIRIELDPSSGMMVNLFHPKVTEAGIGLDDVAVDLGEENAHTITVVTVDCAEPAEARRFILGNVYQDLDGDGTFNPTEGVYGLTVGIQSLAGTEVIKAVETGLFGSFQIQTDSSAVFFLLVVMDEDSDVLDEYLIVSQLDNKLIDFVVGAP